MQNIRLECARLCVHNFFIRQWIRNGERGMGGGLSFLLCIFYLVSFCFLWNRSSLARVRAEELIYLQDVSKSVRPRAIFKRCFTHPTFPCVHVSF